MKKLIYALTALTVLGSATAYAANCTTRCNWVFKTWTCTETCY